MQLDEHQTVVADHRKGPMLVLAGAGSGKTASITSRAANLIQRGYRPASLLLTTFSKKAANEMKGRLSDLVGQELALQAKICTFHSLGDSIIKEWPEECGRREGVSILDESDQRGLFRRLLKEVAKVEDLTKLDHRRWLSAYDRLAQDGMRAVDSRHAGRFAQIMHSHAGIDRQDQLNWLWRVFGAFERFKAEQNVVDFNDLLTLPYDALQQYSELRETLAMRYDFVTVDEAQDTSLSQYEIIKSFASQHGNVVVVGDDDQSLYGWRGASVANLKRFIDDFSPRIARLERNYRSTRPIVAAAASHIAHNPGRLEKKPYSERDEGAGPVFHEMADNRDMAHAIVADIKLAHAKGVPWQEMAVLYRKNRIGELLEPTLIEHNVPYEVYGGKKLADRKEVKLAMAMARLVLNRNDQMAFTQLAQGIRGLGERGLERFFGYAEQFHQGNLFEATEGIRQAATRERVDELGQLITVMSRRSPTELIPTLVEDWGIEGNFPKDTPAQLEQRRERLAMFSEWIALLVEKQERLEPDADAWRSIMNATLEEPEADMSAGDKVILSTVHRAKGLEWDNVFIAGASDGLMPMRNQAGEIGDENEERCTSYVALTRARTACALYHCQLLHLGYDTQAMMPSPFLSEMGAQKGRAIGDPLPPILKFKPNGAVDTADLVRQKMDLGMGAEQPNPASQGAPEPLDPYAAEEIPGW